MKSPYGFEWMPGVSLFGAVLILLIVPSFALIGLAVVAVAAVAAVAALAGAILASPYLLVRTLRRRFAERHESTEGSASGAAVMARAAGATNS